MNWPTVKTEDLFDFLALTSTNQLRFLFLPCRQLEGATSSPLGGSLRLMLPFLWTSFPSYCYLLFLASTSPSACTVSSHRTFTPASIGTIFGCVFRTLSIACILQLLLAPPDTHTFKCLQLVLKHDFVICWTFSFLFVAEQGWSEQGWSEHSCCD